MVSGAGGQLKTMQAVSQVQSSGAGGGVKMVMVTSGQLAQVCSHSCNISFFHFVIAWKVPKGLPSRDFCLLSMAQLISVKPCCEKNTMILRLWPYLNLLPGDYQISDGSAGRIRCSGRGWHQNCLLTGPRRGKTGDNTGKPISHNKFWKINELKCYCIKYVFLRCKICFTALRRMNDNLSSFYKISRKCFGGLLWTPSSAWLFLM